MIDIKDELVVQNFEVKKSREVYRKEADQTAKLAESTLDSRSKVILDLTNNLQI